MKTVYASVIRTDRDDIAVEVKHDLEGPILSISHGEKTIVIPSELITMFHQAMDEATYRIEHP